MKIKYIVAAALVVSSAFPAVTFGKSDKTDGSERLTDYVNPFVGTDGYGNVYPAYR